jgi:hypothetical protein
MTMAGFYAFRAAAADWGVFISGVAGGAYETSAAGQVRDSLIWDDIRSGVSTENQESSRQVRSQIGLVTSRPWAFGIDLVEAQKGTAYFRLWRFYPGPPAEGGVE